MGAIAAEVFCGILSVFGVVLVGLLIAELRKTARLKSHVKEADAALTASDDELKQLNQDYELQRRKIDRDARIMDPSRFR